MLNLYPYLCDDPDMDLSPIREKSERLYRDILRERQYYAEHPECQNIHFFHLVKQYKKSSIWIDRWGKMVLSFKRGRWSALRFDLTDNPAMRKNGAKGYYKIRGLKIDGKEGHIYIHKLMADTYLPNDDFTKSQMDHLNSEHLDNNALNLERVTPQENYRRREVSIYRKKGKPLPLKYQTPENYLNYLQTKNSKS